MSILDFLKSIWKVPPDRLDEPENKGPSYSEEFFLNIVWECIRCGNEFAADNSSGVVCPNCNRNHTLSEDDFPTPIRAECLRCGKVSTAVGGFRAENISFTCPECGFWWKSSPW